MASVIDRLRARRNTASEPTDHRRSVNLDWLEYMQAMGWGSVNPRTNVEETFTGMLTAVHRTYGPVPAAVAARSFLMGQFRPKWRSLLDDKNLFGKPSLEPLENPKFFPRAQLMRNAELHVSYGGTAFFHRRPYDEANDGITLLHPDRVGIIIGVGDHDPESIAATDGLKYLPEARPIGYRYNTAPDGGRPTWRYFGTEDVTHWAPEPDPDRRFIGLSWVQSVLRDILGDQQVNRHIDSFFEKGAVPGMAIVWPEEVADDDLDTYIEMLAKNHSGAENAGKSLVLGGGANVTTIGAQLNSLELANITAGYEAHIASRSQVPAVILGIKEALQGSSLNQGNYAAARRQWADKWVTSTLETLCQSLRPLLGRGPAMSELWYDPDEIPFLQEDQLDKAQIAQTNTNAIISLVREGFDADAAVESVHSGRVSVLKGQHNGLPSVQQQVPEEETNDEPEQPDTDERGGDDGSVDDDDD